MANGTGPLSNSREYHRGPDKHAKSRRRPTARRYRKRGHGSKRILSRKAEGGVQGKSGGLER